MTIRGIEMQFGMDSAEGCQILRTETQKLSFGSFFLSIFVIVFVGATQDASFKQAYVHVYVHVSRLAFPIR